MSFLPLIKAGPGILSTIFTYERERTITPFSLSFDITSKCNLRCQHCYIYKQENEKWEMNKLSEDTHNHKFSLIEKIKADNPKIIHSTLVGGEPLMPNVAEPLTRLVTRLFPLNWVVTNGTFPIPEDYDCKDSLTTFVVSLDGKKEYHDNLRGNGVFIKAMKNIENTNARVYSHSVITSENRDGMEELVQQLHDQTKLRGVRFSFYTPENCVEDKLWTPLDERDKIVDRLHLLKNKYGGFIWMSNDEIDAFYGKNLLSAFGENCALLRGATYSMDFYGNKKEKCVMGSKTDCYRCGCTVPTMMYSILERRSLSTLLSLLKTFI